MWDALASPTRRMPANGDRTEHLQLEDGFACATPTPAYGVRPLPLAPIPVVLRCKLEGAGRPELHKKSGTKAMCVMYIFYASGACLLYVCICICVYVSYVLYARTCDPYNTYTQLSQTKILGGNFGHPHNPLEKRSVCWHDG